MADSVIPDGAGAPVAFSYVEHGVRTTFYGESGATNYGGDEAAAMAAFKKPVTQGQARELLTRRVWVGEWTRCALVAPSVSTQEEMKGETDGR